MMRPYSEGDWPEVAAIYDLAKPDEMDGLVDPDRIVPLADDDRMLAYFQDSEIWVYDDFGGILGFIGRRENVISWLFVHPEHRRKGIARSLLRGVMAEHEGSLRLNLTKTNKAAMALYRGLGFEVYEEFEGSMYGQAIPAVRMRSGRDTKPNKSE